MGNHHLSEESESAPIQIKVADRPFAGSILSEAEGLRVTDVKLFVTTYLGGLRPAFFCHLGHLKP
jgi:hypothetical protein